MGSHCVAIFLHIPYVHILALKYLMMIQEGPKHVVLLVIKDYKDTFIVVFDDFINILYYICYYYYYYHHLHHLLNRFWIGNIFHLYCCKYTCKSVKNNYSIIATATCFGPHDNLYGIYVYNFRCT